MIAMEQHVSVIVEPERYIKEFAECGADGITFHLEATKNPQAVIDQIHACGKEAGISIKPGTALEEIYPYLDKVERNGGKDIN